MPLAPVFDFEVNLKFQCQVPWSFPPAFKPCEDKIPYVLILDSLDNLSGAYRETQFPQLPELKYAYIDCRIINMIRDVFNLFPFLY